MKKLKLQKVRTLSKQQQESVIELSIRTPGKLISGPMWGVLILSALVLQRVQLIPEVELNINLMMSGSSDVQE